MARRTNPFEELYVSETIPPKEFVQLFSDFLVQHALQLFQPGNVVLMGVQGSGKSMLLSLLHPSIRVAYAEAQVDFPVPPQYSRFLGAGINLRRSGAVNFGQRPLEPDPDEDAAQFPIYFGDFLNYWVVADLLATVDTYARRANGRIAEDLGLQTSADRLNEFASAVASDSCWFGALDGVRTHVELQQALQSRIGSYFRFLNYNSDTLNPRIKETKTAIGAPVAATALHLRRLGIVPADVHVFVQIDQYEEMTHLAQVRGELGTKYRRIVNRALGMRDQQVSYRIGARGWAWRDDLTMYGSGASLERDREYSEVNLDELLRRRENSKTYIFPQFAEDVVRRRLRFAQYAVDRVDGPVIRHLFGKRPASEDRAQRYVRQSGGCTPDRIVSLTGLPKAWQDFLLETAAHEPLDARFAEAWARQQRGSRAALQPSRDPKTNTWPWQKEYWRKERRDQALMQLAASCAQRMLWAGEEDMIALCGGNILIFVSLCRQVWAAYSRADRGTFRNTELGLLPVPRIDARVQSVGIEETSHHWYRKTPEQPGGHARQRFLDVLALTFQRRLLDDRAMSYPGHNGFSLAVEDLDSDAGLREFLRAAVDYGDLVEVPHTTKERDRRPRIKWYLKPVLSPFFRIPVGHVKEPLYVTLENVREWIQGAGIDTVVRAVPVQDQITFAFDG